MQFLKEKLQKANATIKELTYKEDWKNLTETILYRKVGTDIEINATQLPIREWPVSSETNIGTLPVGYRPPHNIFTMAHVQTADREVYTLRVLIYTDGFVKIQNPRNIAINSNYGNFFLKYSIL